LRRSLQQVYLACVQHALHDAALHNTQEHLIVFANQCRCWFAAGDDGYIDARTVKAWAMVESGGSKIAFLSDPMQVNNSGDWVDTKATVAGLQRHMEMTPRVSVRAALRWWNYKGTLWAADESRSGWRGNFAAFVRYNGNGRIESGRYSCYPHKFRYAADVQRLSR
jgi:predicted amidohydrolase YtcJ